MIPREQRATLSLGVELRASGWKPDGSGALSSPFYTAWTALALAFVLGWSAQATAQEPDPAALRARETLTELKKTRGNVLGLGPAVELEDYLQWLPMPQVDALLDQAIKARPHPLAQVILERARARQTLRRGDRAQAVATITGQGFLTDWQVLGPFPNEGMSGMNTAYPPEQKLDLNATVDTRIGDTRWQRMKHMDHLGWVDLEAVVRPIENMVV
ncbi:MAG: hypothetical protein AAFS10_15850, partial [Myxococcota bacterium]